MFYPKNQPKPFHLTSPDREVGVSGITTHVAVRFTLRCGLQFAFDPTGAQIGWREVLSPWNSYQAHRVRLLTSETPLGFDDHALLLDGPVARGEDCSHVPTELGYIGKQLFIFLATTFTLAAQDTTGGVSASNLENMFCQLTDAKYEQAMTPVVEHAMKMLREKIEEFRRGPCGRMYWDQDMACSLTRDERMYKCLKKVWLTEKEYDETVDARLGALWKSRFKRAMWDMPSVGKTVCMCRGSMISDGK